MQEEEANQTGDDLAEYLEKGGKVVVLGWAAFKGGKYGFRGLQHSLHSFTFTIQIFTWGRKKGISKTSCMQWF